MKTTKKRKVLAVLQSTPFTLGRKQFASISAIEGLPVTQEMLREFEEFDRKETPARERRRAIISGFTKSIA